MVRDAKAQLPLDTVETFKLPSGLEVIFQENNSAPSGSHAILGKDRKHS